MELYIIRHGQSLNNALMEDQELRVQDPDLTDLGWQQANCLAEFLATANNLEELVRHSMDSPQREVPSRYNITHLYCSPMRRALQTAQPIGKALGLKPEVWTEIHEHGGIYLERHGVIKGFTGMTRGQILQEFADYVLPDSITETGWWNPDSGREDIEACRARAMRVTKSLVDRAQDEDSKNDRLALVAHGTFMDCLLKSLLNTLPGEYYYHWHYNTAITRFDIWPNRRVVVRYMNRISHLSPELVTS